MGEAVDGRGNNGREKGGKRGERSQDGRVKGNETREQGVEDVY